jgi:filamentous hemagglutinin family protein
LSTNNFFCWFDFRGFSFVPSVVTDIIKSPSILLDSLGQDLGSSFSRCQLETDGCLHIQQVTTFSRKIDYLQRVYFANPSGIANILSRVTGRDVSDIMGTLGVDGAANLFLLNPNGIIFGPNARLDVRGSFTASTANSFTFPDGTQFSATNPGDSSLLSVSVPLGVQYGPRLRGDITNAGSLAVNPGQGITLYGGTVRSSGSLTAPGGIVQVLGDRVALTDNARIDVSGETGGGTVLVGGDYRGQGTVPNALRTFVGSGVTINADALTSGNGGRVIVWADEATGFYGTLTARGGVNAGNGGFAEVSGRTSLDFSGRADLSARQGQFGTLLLDPRNITVVPGSNNPSDLPSGGGDELLFGDNPGGDSTVNNGTIDAQRTNVTLQATNNITFNAPVSLSTPGVGLTAEAGNNIEVNQPILTNRGAISLTANTDNSIAVPGRGSLTINAGVSSRAGEMSLSADNITVRPFLRESAVVQTIDESGVSGNLNINTRELHILDGGQVSVGTFSSGRAGNINIQNADLKADLVEVSGIATDSKGTSISSTLKTQVEDRSGATGDGGNLTINTRNLRISNGGLVTASTFSSGDAGNIDIQNADLVEVSGEGSRLAVQATGEGSVAGSLTINTNQLLLQDGANVTLLIVLISLAVMGGK